LRTIRPVVAYPIAFIQPPGKHVRWRSIRPPESIPVVEGSACPHPRLRFDWISEPACLDLGCGPATYLFMLRELGYSNMAAWTSAGSGCRLHVKIARMLFNVMHRDTSVHPHSFDLSLLRVVEHFKKDECSTPGLIFVEVVDRYRSMRSPRGLALHRIYDHDHELQESNSSSS